MAKCHQPLTWLAPGLTAATFIVTVLLAALIALWQFSFTDFDLPFLLSAELWRVFAFTLKQAVLSVILSVLLGLVLAKVTYPLVFIGKALLLRFYIITFALPALVLVIALPQIYGRQGWLAVLSQFLGIEYTFSIYGLAGILLAHVFYNLPFTFRLFHQSLDSIAVEQQQLSAQLGLSYWQHFRYVEWPVLSRQLLPTAALIFMLCFTSFVIILALGGGPKNTTFEVAIYQSFRDFEFNKVTILSLVQLVFCIGFTFLLRRLAPNTSPLGEFSHKRFYPPLSKLQTLMGYSVILLTALYLLSPIFSVILNGLAAFSWALLMNKTLLMATFTSFMIAVGAGFFAQFLAVLLLWTTSRLQCEGYYRYSDLLMLSGSFILAIPGMVVASGFFLLLYGIENNAMVIAMLMMLSNGLMSLPFVLKLLENPMTSLVSRYDLLTKSLNINGINRFYWVDFQALKSLYSFTFALSCVMSLGDFGIIALFGSQDFVTLPFYLYSQLDTYHHDAANFTAFLLLIFCLGMFAFFDLMIKKL